MFTCSNLTYFIQTLNVENRTYRTNILFVTLCEILILIVLERKCYYTNYCLCLLQFFVK